MFQARSVRKYAVFMSRYVGSLAGRRTPLLGGIKLTHACNLRCIHCPFREREKVSLSFQQAKDAMRTLYGWGVRLLIIEGGEPFLWKDGEHSLEDIVAEGRKRFLFTGIATNGTFPLRTAADAVWVSIDGLAATHDSIRGESFEKIVGNIEASSHPRIYAHITVNSLNWSEVPELVRFISAKVYGITVQFHYPYDGVKEDLFLKPKHRIAVLDELIALKRDGWNVANSCVCLEALKDNRWKCRPWMVASVDPDGRAVKGCYLKGRTDISCERCGFSAHAEMSLAYSGVPQAIRTGLRIFG